MVLQAWQDLLQWEEESFAWGVAVGVHVKPHPRPLSRGRGGKGLKELVEDGLREEGGGGDGDGFVTCREHGPAVGRAFGDEERLAHSQPVQYGQIVDAASGAAGEAEAKTPSNSPFRGRTQVAVLHADEFALLVVVGDLEPVRALAVAEGVESAPTDDARVELPFVEEELAGFCVQKRVLEILLVTRSVEGRPFSCRYVGITV